MGRAVSVLVLMVLVGTVCAEQEVVEKSIFNLSDKVDECSGIVASRSYPGVFWTHEDGGLSNNLYAVDAEGDFLFKTDVAGAKNVDWEDIAIGPCDPGAEDCGCLYIADIGDNDLVRGGGVIYRLPEPQPLSAATPTTDSRTASTAAGVRPGRRLAWPMVSGRIRLNTSRASADNPPTIR